ncbi:VWA domain-containing protein [Alishewanella sp. d11]|uniref:vWA domain-containing protein n=1 Tax=Alishewanella sp. d11 TaxID=3414030 RepID=UPI003BF88EDD
MLADFHLLRPFWLLALLPVAVFWWLLYSHRQDFSPWQQLIANHLQPIVLISQQLQHKQPWAMPLLALCWLLSVLALSGPTWQKLPQPALTVKNATVLIMDMSLSMRATDMAPDRLTQQRFKALDFVETLREGDLALISFAAEAFVISPLTPDHNNIRLQIPTLRPELMPAQGSNVLSALQLAASLLQQAGYPTGDVVLFTDGFDSDSYHEIQQLLNNWPYRLSILALGQSEGAVVRLENGELLKNRQGAVVIPRVPLQQLQVLARQGGGVFQAATADNRDLQAIADNRLSNSNQRQPEQQVFAGDQWQDNAVYLVWLLLPFALWLARRAPILLLLPALYLPQADARSWQSLWQSKEQQAQQHYAQQEFEQAQQKFSDPLWRGNAAYRSGQYDQAAQAFWQALEQQPSAAAWHNLGNALAMQQQYQQALDAYQEALKLDENNAAAKANAELMRQLLQQQNEQQQQQSEQQGESSEQQSAEQSASAEQQKSAEQQQSAAQNSPSSPQSSTEQQTAESEQQTAEAQQQQASASAEETVNKEEAEQMAQQKLVEQNWPNATPEQQQELENLLRKVQDDPGILLRNRMLLEHQKRRTQPPSGARQEW